MTTAVLSLGSNQGDRERWLAFARKKLATQHCRVTAESKIRETEPVGAPEEFKDTLYLNQVVFVETNLSADAFSDFIHGIEAEAGRVRTGRRNIPRTLDIDIITFGDLVRRTPDLILPHPRARERRFVLEPLAELQPDFRFPDAPDKTVREFLAALS
jgi:2-amino-4-hydroxy-6-hydroxymethyldihydropteridine diphosphokinase